MSLPYIFQVLYVLCFTRPRYQVSVYRTNGHLVVYSVPSFAFSDFDSEGMILILIATVLADWLYFYLSVHNSHLLTFISGI